MDNMIQLKKMNVVREVDSEVKAQLLETRGFIRMTPAEQGVEGDSAEPSAKMTAEETAAKKEAATKKAAEKAEAKKKAAEDAAAKKAAEAAAATQTPAEPAAKANAAPDSQ